mmetsp:Transcript_93099/g.260349  ORF Transcript_93099/g.260349 Transcript_93099/m.260349 type:complete len:353 (+) Transcript_93099:347-1405(+)
MGSFQWYSTVPASPNMLCAASRILVLMTDESFDITLPCVFRSDAGSWHFSEISSSACAQSPIKNSTGAFHNNVVSLPRAASQSSSPTASTPNNLTASSSLILYFLQISSLSRMSVAFISRSSLSTTRSDIITFFVGFACFTLWPNNPSLLLHCTSTQYFVPTGPMGTSFASDTPTKTYDGLASPALSALGKAGTDCNNKSRHSALKYNVPKSPCSPRPSTDNGTSLPPLAMRSAMRTEATPKKSCLPKESWSSSSNVTTCSLGWWMGKRTCSSNVGFSVALTTCVWNFIAPQANFTNGSDVGPPMSLLSIPRKPAARQMVMSSIPRGRGCNTVNMSASGAKRKPIRFGKTIL